MGEFVQHQQRHDADHRRKARLGRALDPSGIGIDIRWIATHGGFHDLRRDDRNDANDRSAETVEEGGQKLPATEDQSRWFEVGKDEDVQEANCQSSPCCGSAFLAGHARRW